MSVAEILSLVKKKHGPESVDKVSIYRTVEKLIDLSLVHRVGPAGEIFRCAHTACSHAYHLLLSCLSCNEVQELHVGDKAVAPLVEFIRSSQGFQVDPHEIRARGLCAKCGAKVKGKGAGLKVIN